MNVTWTQLDDAIYALLVMALLYLGILVGYALADWRKWMAARAASRVPVGDDTLAMLADANDDAELAARTDLDADVYAWLCPACNGTGGVNCCCVEPCGSQACDPRTVRRG